MREPETSAEWQEAVDAAAGLRAIADCKMYGLLEGGPQINVERCDDILKYGRARGVYPSKPDTDLAVAMVAAINSAPSPENRNKRRASGGEDEELQNLYHAINESAGS